MSTPSNWPLPASSIRYLVPSSIISQLSLNTVSRGLYPLAFGYYKKAFDHKVSRNNHSDNLMILCTEGKGKVTTGQFSSTIEAGQVLILPTGITHEYESDTNNPWTIYWVHMAGQLFEHYQQILNVTDDSLILELQDTTPVIEEFEQLLQSRYSIYQHNKYMVTSNIVQKMMSLIVCHSQSSAPINAQQLSFQNIDAYLEQRLSQSISLEEMASAVGYSKYHFAKKFQQEMGISPVRYFLELKIKNACELMDRSLLSVKQVAAELGYEDPYYFSRLFKKVMGISPKQYRQSKV